MKGPSGPFLFGDYMALGDAYKASRDVIAKALTTMISSSAVWVKGPLAWACTASIKWIMNIVTRPLYDYLERKKVEAPINKDIEQKIDAVKTAKTEAEINHAIDEMP